MMLLTSGQISMTISSGIVFIFTTLLFLSGYVLQQQTVRNLQAAIKPPSPPPSHTLSLSASASTTAVARVFGDPPGSPGRVAYEEYLTESRPKNGWRKVAYVQLVTEHLHLCSAVMLFAELAQQKSKAERVLLYPKVWDRREDRDQEPLNPYIETSRRLFQMASDRYGVVLRAMEPNGAEEILPSTYPLAELLALANYNRILYLQPPGLLLNSTKLDRLLATSSKNLRTDQSTKVPISRDSTPILLLAPSEVDFSQAHDQLAAGQVPDNELLARVFSEQNLIPPPSDDNRLVLEISYMKTEPQESEAMTLASSASYLHFSDPALPGPEYDIPRDVFSRQAPREDPTRRFWESSYEKFRDLRMEVCGLDLEPMPREAVKPPDVLETDGHERG